MIDRGVQAYEVLRHVRPLHLYSAQVVAAMLKESAVTVPLRAILELLVEHGEQTVPSLARRMLVTRQAAQKIVNQGVERGLLDLADNPAHHRSRLVGATVTGQREFARIRQAESLRLAQAAEELTAEELAVCADVLGRLSAAVARLRQSADESPLGGSD